MEPKTILIVDDDPATVRLLELNYRAEGYRVLTGYDGAEGVRQALLGKPDLIVLDLIMPHLDGYEALRALKSHPETADIPVILLTGKSDSEDIAEGWTYDIEFYMTKPYVMEDLLELTERILSSRDELSLQ
jgi:two-component system alkaline phosphatase synthesis response regulator PhoP